MDAARFGAFWTVSFAHMARSSLKARLVERVTCSRQQHTPDCLLLRKSQWDGVHEPARANATPTFVVPSEGVTNYLPQCVWEGRKRRCVLESRAHYFIANPHRLLFYGGQRRSQLHAQMQYRISQPRKSAASNITHCSWNTVAYSPGAAAWKRYT